MKEQFGTEYEGRIVKSRNGTAKYMCICRDWFGKYVLQSCRSHDRLMVVPRYVLDRDWIIEDEGKHHGYRD